MNFIKCFLVIFMVLALAPNAKSDETERMFFNKPKHVIFLIHGIGGDKTHFGYMSKALAKRLNQMDLDTKYIVRSIEYDTGHNEKTPYEFAEDVNKVIQRTTESKNFKDEDKISLIMHSQGGLIGSIWMFQSMMSVPGFADPETIEHVDAFITLGSPFWGAKTAKWGGQMKDLAERLKIDVPLRYGRKELDQMTFGSDMIHDFRMAMIDPQYKDVIEYLKTHVRFLNIVGVADLLNPLGIFVSGTSQYEDDGAVPLSSARFNFFYSQELSQGYKDGERVSADNVKEIDMAPYVVVNAMHRSPLPEIPNWYGIAQIPKKCIHEDICGHPTFPYIWQHLLGYPITQIDDSLGDFKSFLIDINVRIDSEIEYEFGDVKVELFKLDGSPLKDSNIAIFNFFELYSEGNRKSDKHDNQFRFYFTGNIKKALEGRNETVLVKFSGKGLKTRFVEMKLKQTYSSFIDILLEQKD